MRDIKEFGLYVANKRKELCMTQENLANMIGITPQAVSKWENGIGYPDVTLFSELAKVLNVSVSELFGEETKERKDNTVPDIFRGLQLVKFASLPSLKVNTPFFSFILSIFFEE